MPELQPLRADHADTLLDFERTNRDYFATFISDRGEPFFEHFAEIHQARLDEQRAGRGVYFVLVDADQTIVGRVNLVIDDDGSAVLGYRIAERVAGRGVATAAVREVCRAAADRGLRRVRAATSHANLASQRVLEKCGFTDAGPADPSELGGKSGRRYELVLPG